MKTLRERYEESLGEVSDRHWSRICQEWLDINPDAEPTLNNRRLIDAYIVLRMNNPRSRIRKEQIVNYIEFVEQFPTVLCKGSDLLEGVRRVLTPTPSIKTIYRWGQEIGCPFNQERWYQPCEVRKWMQKIIGQQRFKIVRQFPGIQKMAA